MNSLRRQLSELLDADDSEIANFERLVASYRSKELSKFVLEQSNLLQSVESYVAIEDHRSHREINSVSREKATLYLEELLHLWREGTISFPEYIYRKARFALLRGYLGRLEELDAIICYEHKAYHLPINSFETDQVFELEEETKSAVSELMQEIGITDPDDTDFNFRLN